MFIYVIRYTIGYKCRIITLKFEVNTQLVLVYKSLLKCNLAKH